MRLYHFSNKQYGLEDLQEKRLKVARIMELNDPFEFLGTDLSNPEFCKAMQEMKKGLSEEYGILCFGEGWDNPVQWAHYADGHKGLCLGFDIPDHLLAKVNYVDERLPVDDLLADFNALRDRLAGEMDDCIGRPESRDEFEAGKVKFLDGLPRRLREEPDSDASQAFKKTIIATKFSHWSYEKEYRFFVPLRNKESDGPYYADFSDEIKLKEVIVGVRSGVTRAQIEDALGEMASRVGAIKACEDTRKFAVVKDENNAF